jgi:hypothetical protein
MLTQICIEGKHHYIYVGTFKQTKKQGYKVWTELSKSSYYCCVEHVHTDVKTAGCARQTRSKNIDKNLGNLTRKSGSNEIRKSAN